MLKARIQTTLILNIGFGAAALAVFGTVDYMTRAQAEGPGYSIGSYFSEVVGRIDLYHEKTVRIADTFPEPPEGWERHVFQAEDLSRLTGQPVDDSHRGKKVSLAEVAVGAQMGLVGADRAEYRTYTSGDRTVLVKITYIPTSVFHGIGGKQIEMMLQFADLEALDMPFFGTVKGLEFHEAKKKAYGVARAITANLGPQVDVTVLTTEEDDQTILDLVSGLDVAGLNTLLAEPIQGMGEGPTGFAPQMSPAERVQGFSALMRAALRDAGKGAGGPTPEGASAAATDAAVGNGGTGGSFLSRMMGGLTGKPAPQAAAEKPPTTFTCTNDRGFKRCSAVPAD